jgi:hypothetical protein
MPLFGGGAGSVWRNQSHFPSPKITSDALVDVGIDDRIVVLAPDGRRVSRTGSNLFDCPRMQTGT